MKTILLIRHGKTAAREGAFCGSTDIALSSEGKRQSQKIVHELVNRSVQLVITTGLQRTDYCGNLAEKVGITHIVEPDLREVDFGSWEGMTWEEIENIYPEQAQTWLDHSGTMHFPDGEDMVRFQKRVRQAWEQLVIRPEERIAIVGHSGVLSYVLHRIGKKKEPIYVRHGEIIQLQIKTPTDR